MIRLILILVLIPLSTSSLKYKTVNKIQTIEKIYTVTLTTYSVNIKETDSTPNITASGFIVDSVNPKKHRILAVSHDLKKKFKYLSLKRTRFTITSRKLNQRMVELNQKEF